MSCGEIISAYCENKTNYIHSYILQSKCKVESVNTCTPMLCYLLMKFLLPADHIKVGGILSHSTTVLGYIQVLISTLDSLLILYFQIVRT